MKTLLLIVIMAAGSAFAQDAPPVLRNNPFSRPPSDVIVDDRVSAATEEVDTSTIELQATMIGGTNKLANVGGRILQTNDVVHGWRVAEIHEQYVVFEREGNAMTVFVKPLVADDRNPESASDRGRTGRRR